MMLQVETWLLGCYRWEADQEATSDEGWTAQWFQRGQHGQSQMVVANLYVCGGHSM
jgi:hypothetical protein